MSDGSGTCEYVLNPDDPETWGGEEGDECSVRPSILNDEGTWSCPHNSGKNRFCIFHRPLNKKNNEKAVQRLIELVEREENGSIEILNSKFEDLNISKVIENADSDTVIDMTQADILGELNAKGANINPELLLTQICCRDGVNLSQSVFNSPVDLTGSYIQDNCDLYQSNFKDTINFNSAKITGELNCERANFEEYAGFGAEFNGNVSFGIRQAPEESAIFNGPAYFLGAEFYQKVIFAGVDFHDEAQFAHIEVNNKNKSYFTRIDFADYASFWDSEFDGTVDFTGTEFEDNVDFREAKFHSECWFQKNKFYGGVSFQDVEFNEKVRFFKVDFYHEADFTSGEITMGSEFERCKFHEEAIFSGCDLIDCTLSDSDFSGAIFNDTELVGSNFESAILTQATLFRADLRGAKLNGTLLGDVRIDEETQFLGHPDDDSSSTSYTFSSWLSKPSVVYDEKYGEKQSALSYLISLPLYFLLSIYGIILFTVNLIPKEPKRNFRSWARWLGGHIWPLTLEPIEWMKNEPEESEKETDGENTGGDAKFADEQQDGNDTETDGDNENQDDSKNAQTDGGNRSEIGDQDDPVDKDKAKSVYRALEELGGKAARSRLQSQAFVRRQDVQKREYKRRAVDGSLRQERVIGAAKYLRAKVARVTLLYGESPWRIVGISSTFVVLVGMLYPLFGWVQPREDGAEPITWTRICDGEPHLLLESIYFSALTFTTLGMGDYEPVGGGGQVLATLNTVFGAVLIALLVFVFGRRAAR